MKTILYLCFLSSVGMAFGQNTIQGTVTDAETGDSLSYVNLYIPHLEKGTTTNDSGNFTLEGIPSGSHTLVCSFIGYETKSINVNIPITESLSIALTPSAIEMEAVIISTPFHKLQSDNVMKVEHKTISELRSSGSVTLADGITNIAGVNAVSTGLSISKPVIRGLSSNRVLVYTQGVRLENQQFGSEHGLGLSDAGVESVEVIKGPASLLYGSDALGGVLYINPERFADANDQSGSVNLNYFSNTEGYNTSLGYKSSGNAFKFLFRGSLAAHSDYNTADYRVTNTRFQEQDFKAGLGYQSTKFKTEFRYNVNHSKLGIPEEIGLQSTDKSPLLPYQDITNHVFSSKSKVFFNNSKLEINLGYIYNSRQEFEDEHEHEAHDEHEGEEEADHHEEHEEHVAEEAALNMKLKTANYDVKYHLPIMGKFETIVGVQGMHQTNTNYGEEELIPNATTNDLGIFAMSHIHFENFDVQLGARYDNRWLNIDGGENLNFNSFNGALGFKTSLFDHIIARLNLASGFRAPNLAELTSDGVHHGTNRYEIGNSNLTYEQNYQTDLALEYKSEHIEFFVNGFYNLVNDYIYLEPDGTEIDGEAVFNYVQNDAYLYGGEIGFHLHPHPLDWLHFESSFESVTGKLKAGNYLPLIPANSINNTIRVEFDSKKLKQTYAFVKLQSTFSQNNVGTFETATGSYNLLSAGFGSTVSLFKNDLSISIAGTNLTDKNYISHLSRLKPDGIFNMGRNISIGFTYNL
ncbi:TonB-dependent receptor [Hanstruepera neustonica]|uniref:TonB-dependent receptor n=1 Tax=Hanstruepera neustonica TaxID=1445657 RepID=A0A2K1DYP4_9FLAO|nr:TonB-dependent receptor [Hanstruepera neustonica]PNQ73134.1 TonB-dependent receptor [Hanstruepera neustonica]